MARPDSSLAALRDAMRRFAAARDWQQFHTPKNLAIALSVEAAELLEHFQWLTEAESRGLGPQKRQEVGSELADVLLYLVQLATALGLDPIAEAEKKLALNEERYPVARARGSSAKHSEL